MLRAFVKRWNRSWVVEEIQDLRESDYEFQSIFSWVRKYITYRYKRALSKSNSTDKDIKPFWQ